MRFSSKKYGWACHLRAAFALLALRQPAPTTVRVVDARTHQPIPYASVGVRGRPLGTVADAQGRFFPTQTGATPTDTLVVSCVGYQPRRLPLAALQQLPELPLELQTQALGEVVVRGAQARPVMLGHRGVSSFTAFGFYTQADTVPHERLGREFGVLLHVKRPTQLQRFRVFTSSRQFRRVTFRLNLYAVRDGQPQASLLTRDITFTVPGQQRGWTELDLQPYAITLAGPQDVAATLQWVDSEKNQPGDRFFDIPAHLSATHTSFRRDKSGQGWTTLRVNPSLYFTGLQDAE